MKLSLPVIILTAGLSASVLAAPSRSSSFNKLGLGLDDLISDYQAASSPVAVKATSGKKGKAAAKKAAAKQLSPAAKLDAIAANYSHLRQDHKGNVLVEIYLDGTAPARMRSAFKQMGVKVTGEVDWYRHGVMSAWVPIDKASQLANMSGIHTARISIAPHYRAAPPTYRPGPVSQGSKVLHADSVNAAGYTGKNVKVGVISDSFNDTMPQDKFGVPDKAENDVMNDDLPGTGNPNGHTDDVDVVAEDTTLAALATDEGRGMCQIVHDMAPDAKIAFATAEGGEAAFANNIVRLGSPPSVMVPVDPSIPAVTQPGAGCNVVCDDVAYLAEPMYSDGVIAQAIDFVATQYQVSYFSSAGNDGNAGYQADFSYVDPATQIDADNMVTAPDGTKLDFTPGLFDLNKVDPAYYAGGFHAFGTDANNHPIVVQKVTTGSLAVSLVLQWDDPFDNSAITTDYNILVFDTTGKYKRLLSGVKNNMNTDEPIESPQMTLDASTTYYIVITRATPSGNGPSVAKHMRYVAESDGGGFTGDFINLDNVETYGHNCAANCSGTAAYAYDAIPNVAQDPSHVFTPLIEPFSSNGPVNIYFDANGNRLSTPNRRRQPAFAAIDGVDTSFFPPATTNVVVPGATPPALPPYPITPPADPPTFGPNPNDYDGNGWPNFFGTSAASPHAASVAALIIQAAADNGLGTLSPSYIRALMQSTTQGQIDTAPGFCLASQTSGGYKVNLAGTGDNPSDPNTFALSVVGPNDGHQLTQLIMDLSNSNLVFDESSSGYPFTQGNLGQSNAGGATLQTTPQPALNADRTQATLLFSGFNPGDTITFGVDRDVKGINAYGNGVDQLQGSTFTATISNGTPAQDISVIGTFGNLSNRVYNYKAGYGLIDAQAAINKLLSQ